MLVSEVLRSCSHPSVARAAVASIGGPFERDLLRMASEQGQSIGDFAAVQVQRFATEASERDWRVVSASMQREDLALLAGLQIVVTRMMTTSVRVDRSRPDLAGRRTEPSAA